MQTEQISAAALARGAHQAAVEDIVARATVYFAGADPSPEALDQFLTTLPVWTLRGIAPEVFAALPPTERMRLEREYRPQPIAPVHTRRPVSRVLTPAELATLEGLPLAECLTRGRQMQQGPPP